MTSHDAHDPTLQSLGQLPSMSPDRARAERVRARCHAQLGRNRRRSERTAQIVAFVRRVVAPVVVGGLCALYVGALVGTAVGLAWRH